MCVLLLLYACLGVNTARSRLCIVCVCVCMSCLCSVEFRVCGCLFLLFSPLWVGGSPPTFPALCVPPQLYCSVAPALEHSCVKSLLHCCAVVDTYHAAIPITPQATTSPAFPVISDSSCPPFPKSSSFCMITIDLASTDSGPINLMWGSTILMVATPSVFATTFPAHARLARRTRAQQAQHHRSASRAQ